MSWLAAFKHCCTCCCIYIDPCCLACAVLQGNGFVTNRDIIKEFGIHDANPFFTTLLSKPYLDQVVISPHLYEPSVSNRKDFYKVTHALVAQ